MAEPSSEGGRLLDEPREPAPRARRSRWAAVPNALTLLRLLLVPALWVPALLGETVWLGIGLALAASTDVLDGAIARHFGSVSELGSRLDSVADHLLTGSTAAWLILLRPEFLTREATLLLGWLALGAVALLVGWARFRRVGDVHLYSAKVAGTLGYLFAIWLLVFDSYSRPVFIVIISLCYLATAETLLVLLTRRDPDERLGSILQRRREGR